MTSRCLANQFIHVMISCHNPLSVCLALLTHFGQWRITCCCHLLTPALVVAVEYPLSRRARGNNSICAAQAANVLVSDEGKVYLADMGVVAPVRHVSGSTHNHGSPERERVRARHAAVVSTFTGACVSAIAKAAA